MNMTFSAPIRTKFGTLTIYEEKGEIVKIQSGAPIVSCFMAVTPLLNEAKNQIGEYLEGKRQSFDLPLNVQGTDFQKKVWEALETIPYGETRSYKEVAEMIGSPSSFRAVAAANGKNPLPILIPCHRVISADGSISGYNLGVDLKKHLIELERKNK